MSKTYQVLSIDAWADSDSWTWNTWYKAGEITLDIDSPNDEILSLMYQEGFITNPQEGDIEDDQYNLVIVDKKTREPIFAIEYGSTI